ncbi:MAG: hypothetical protein P8177_04600 [Gemmatimonadota bacterium]|jgi:hypothetical protein
MDIRRPAVALLLPLLVFALACGDDDDPTSPGLECEGGTPLSVNETRTGTLEEGDDLDVDGAFLDRYALAVEDGASVVITMDSDDVDAYLWLLSSGGSVIENDDDSGDGFNARIEETLSRGCYLVDATSSFPDDVGDYTLRVQEQ